MSTHNIKHSLLTNKDAMEAAMLRSVLLFNANSKNANSSSNIITKAILSIIINGEGNCDKDVILNILNDRFHLSWDSQELTPHIDKLKHQKLVRINKDDKYEAITKDGDKDFFENLDKESEKFVNIQIEKLDNLLDTTISAAEKEQAKQNIFAALSVYYELYGYEYFDLMVNSDKTAKEDAVAIAKQNLNEKTGELLVRILADTIDRPDDFEKTFLEKWARAFITTQIMNFDPSLRNLKITKLKQKTFVIDTDIALHCLVSNTDLSKSYKKMISKLLGIGCNIIIPSGVIEEICNHGDAAKKQFYYLGESLIEMPEEYQSNVFIEDYVCMVRNDDSKLDCTFDVYLRSIYNPDHPQILGNKIASTFGGNKLKDSFDNENVDQTKVDVLSKALMDIILNTPKSYYRTIEGNEKTCQIDARLFLTILKMNGRENDNKGILNHDCYLLTQSKRTVNAAKSLGFYEKDIICNPNSLIAVLNEIGTLGSDGIDIINLFENPFLLYTANQIWEEIEPLIKKDISIKYGDIMTLRTDVDAKLNRILTDNLDEKIQEAQRLVSRGYSFPQDIAELAQQKDEVIEKNKQLEEENVRLKRELEQARNANQNLQRKEDIELLSKIRKKKGK